MASTNEPAAEGEAPGEATLLVSEFPPPPFYYTEAATLKPPPIPLEALERGTRKAAAAAAAARAEAERQRLADQTGDLTAGVLAGNTEAEEEEGEVVGVFGEIVEDPLLVKPLDSCEDPIVIRDEVKRLNKEVVQGFCNLLSDLVNRPAENKKRRDELQHDVFLMLQETNKFREHQSRELLIEILEKQNEEREKLIQDLEEKIQQADELLGNTAFNTISMDESS
uniref:Mediator of RNA polymerase II transcription subunit 7 n=1 Tax=Pseudo-nitzschia delicatissima TaxID=44447 RepID=A0A7S0UN00_9STRA|mmetsp:Transcript_4863/g.10095  ORF Transcript_4863/g.10095 Transcript_4863/m.10095 type:complete len:224 (+) Transcript_4863:86-757(+)